ANRQSGFQRVRKADAGLEIIFDDRRCESSPAGFARSESGKDQSPWTAPAAGVGNAEVHNGISVALVVKRREKFVPEPDIDRQISAPFDIVLDEQTVIPILGNCAKRQGEHTSLINFSQ